MTRSRTLGIAAVVALATPAIAADSVQLKSGRWIETAVAESMTMSGKPVVIPPAGPQIKHVCLTIAEAADPKLYFATVKSKDRCAIPAGTVNAGTIALVGTCTNDGAPGTASEIAIDGSYGGERYAAKARLTADMDGQPMVIVMNINGRFDGACHGDEESNGELAK